MPKLRQTCTRCSMRRQKCDRKKPCSRCVQNNEEHLCTTQWTNGYNPSVHRKYPKKEASLGTPNTVRSGGSWPDTQTSSDQERSVHDANPTDRERSFSTPSLSSTRSSAAPEPAHATDPLDFIAFNRAAFNDVSIGSLLQSQSKDPYINKDPYDKHKHMMGRTLNQDQNKRVEDEPPTSGAFSPPARAVEVFHLQALMPAKRQVFEMIDYHERYMLYWVGNVYHGPSFRKNLVDAYGQSDILELAELDWRWTALLFSVMAASIIGAPDALSTSWGFPVADRVRLAREYGHATLSCLLLGDYASKFHIYSIQAIVNLHMSEHLVGSSKEFVVYHGAALVIAKGLGLNRLGPHPEDQNPAALNPEQKAALLQREIGRRVWYGLVTQEWLCSTSTGTYGIQKRHFSTIKPAAYNEETMLPALDGTPTATQSTNYLHEIARLLIEYQDDMLDAPPDLTARYNVVLKHDTRLRSLFSEHIPKMFSPRTPYNPSWPRWVYWARRLHQVSYAHKIIMLHQSFLGRSFKNPQFTYSRWACITASKAIIEQMSGQREPEEPQWWVEQAFVVTSGICLTLDLFHRDVNEPEAQEHKQWVERTIELLGTWPSSAIATHGVRLLTSLFNERNRRVGADAVKPTQPAAVAGEPYPNNIAPHSLAHASSETQSAIEQAEAQGFKGWNLDIDGADFDQFMDAFPLETGMENASFFDNMLTVATSEFL